MISNYVERKREKEEYFRRDFQAIGEPNGCGFSFECDADGNPTSENEGQKENFKYAIAYPEKFKDLGAVHHVHEYTVPAHGTCDCGEIVYLTDQYLGACECPGCGRWYNLFGEELLPPEEWGNGGVY